MNTTDTTVSPAAVETSVAVKTLEAQPLSNKVARKGQQFEDLHFQAIIEDCARRKSANGHTISFISKKGKMTLFSGVAAAAKSQCGMSQLEHLSDEQVLLINNEILAFWKRMQNSLLENGYEVVGQKHHVPKLVFDMADRRVSDIHWSATQTFYKKAGKDAKLVAMLAKGAIQKQYDNMLLNPSRYDRSQVTEQRLKLELVEAKIAELEAAKTDSK